MSLAHLFPQLSTAASAAATGAAATAERSKLQRDGYVVLRNVLDSDLVGEMAAHVEWLQAKVGPARKIGGLLAISRLPLPRSRFLFCLQYPDVPPEHLHHPLMRNDRAFEDQSTTTTTKNTNQKQIVPKRF